MALSLYHYFVNRCQIMYIEKIVIDNIRSIGHFEMRFTSPFAGWHVLIGDNGSGKSSVVRAISLALIGPKDAQALRLPLANWVKRGSDKAGVALTIRRDEQYDSYAGQKRSLMRPFEAAVQITVEESSGYEIGKIEKSIRGKTDPFKYVWSGRVGWFSAAFGPFRRFTGGDKEWSKVYYSNPKAAAHLSVFGEDVALTESLEWLQQMRFKSLEKDKRATATLEALKSFINAGGLLPHGAQLTEVSSKGVFFTDGNGQPIEVTQLSDGFRSLLSLIFELVRQLVKTYGDRAVFESIRAGIMTINVPGVVLIDEIDAHLHPTWQTRIGQWFTRYFPNIQFLVTSHSPLICRACEQGTIWRLAAPGTDTASGEITGIERDRLIYGNVLDAYGTEIFGQNVSIAAEAAVKTERLATLNVKSLMGMLNSDEKEELQHLNTIFPTIEK